jgi:hypothetical protein
MINTRIAHGTLLAQVEPARALLALMWLAAVSAQLTKARHLVSASLDVAGTPELLHALLYAAAQAVQQGSVQSLLSAAAATRNSLCGLYPLAVALQALYGSRSSCSCDGSSSEVVSPGMPQLLEYTPAHLIFPRHDSTGFAAFAVYAR